MHYIKSAIGLSVSILFLAGCKKDFLAPGCSTILAPVVARIVPGDADHAIAVDCDHRVLNKRDVTGSAIDYYWF